MCLQAPIKLFLFNTHKKQSVKATSRGFMAGYIPDQSVPLTSVTAGGQVCQRHEDHVNV